MKRITTKLLLSFFLGIAANLAISAEFCTTSLEDAEEEKAAYSECKSLQSAIDEKNSEIKETDDLGHKIALALIISALFEQLHSHKNTTHKSISTLVDTEKYYSQFTGEGFIRTNEPSHLLESSIQSFFLKEGPLSSSITYISVGGQRTVQGLQALINANISINRIINFDLDQNVLNFVRKELEKDPKLNETTLNSVLVDASNESTWKDFIELLDDNEKVFLDLSNMRQDWAGKEGMYPGPIISNFISTIAQKVSVDESIIMEVYWCEIKRNSGPFRNESEFYIHPFTEYTSSPVLQWFLDDKFQSERTKY